MQVFNLVFDSQIRQ